MDEPVSASDADRQFSLLLRGVRDGRSYVITSHGKAVARITPAGRDNRVSARARDVLLKRLESQPVVDFGRWSRDDLYERGQ